MWSADEAAVVFYKSAILGSKCGGWDFGEAHPVATGNDHATLRLQLGAIGDPAGRMLRPLPMGAANMHKQVLRVLAEQPPGLLLDIPAGTGPVGARARALGHTVVEVDLFARAGFRGVIADACARLPFVDGGFDTVLSMEGIEHFENQTGFLRECARVLRPGGILVLTTPNVLHLSSRISGFLTGQRLMKQGFINEVTTLARREPPRIYHGHAYLIDAFRLRYILRVVGMQLDRLYRTNWSTGSFFLTPLVPLVWLATRYALWSGRRHRRRRRHTVAPPAVERDLARLAVSPALLLSRGLIAVAHKEHGKCPPSHIVNRSQARCGAIMG